jgi:hypothetical protein
MVTRDGEENSEEIIPKLSYFRVLKSSSMEKV